MVSHRLQSGTGLVKSFSATPPPETDATKDPKIAELPKGRSAFA